MVLIRWLKSWIAQWFLPLRLRQWQRILLLGVLLAGLLLYPTEVWAQELPKPISEVLLEPTFRPGLSSSDISPEKVNRFVQAYLQVLRLIDQREAELQGAETDLVSLQVEREIEAQAIALIEKAGLTRQEYLQLLGLANSDPEFGERVAAQLQELS